MKFKILRKPKGERQLIIDLPPNLDWFFNREVPDEVVRIIAETYVKEHGREVLKMVSPKAIQRAVEEAVIRKVIN